MHGGRVLGRQPNPLHSRWRPLLPSPARSQPGKKVSHWMPIGGGWRELKGPAAPARTRAPAHTCALVHQQRARSGRAREQRGQQARAHQPRGGRGAGGAAGLQVCQHHRQRGCGRRLLHLRGGRAGLVLDRRMICVYRCGQGGGRCLVRRAGRGGAKRRREGGWHSRPAPRPLAGVHNWINGMGGKKWIALGKRGRGWEDPSRRQVAGRQGAWSAARAQLPGAQPGHNCRPSPLPACGACAPRRGGGPRWRQGPGAHGPRPGRTWRGPGRLRRTRRRRCAWRGGGATPL